MSSHILLLVKRHAHQYAVIENIINCKSLCFICHASIYGLLDTIAGVWMHGRRFEHKATDAKRNTKINLI